MKRLWSRSFGDPESPALVMIHGMGSASSAWRQITPELAKFFCVIHLDLPGHGFSAFDSDIEMDPHSLGEIVFSELKRIGVEKFHLVGNSLGGWVALDIAAEHPENVLSVTCVAPAGLWLSPVNRRLPIGAFARTLARTTYPLAPFFMQYEWARKIGFASVSPKWRELEIKTILDAVRAMGTSRGYYPAWDALLSLRFDKEISPDIPVSIIFGDADTTLPANTSQERSLAPRHSRWVVIPESGHAPMWDHPQEVILIIHETAARVSQ